MGAVTYPDSKVAGFVNDRMIPIQLLANAKPYADDFNVKWTPTVIVLDEDGKEHSRTVGFLPPEEFVPSLLLGIIKAHFDLNHFQPTSGGGVSFPRGGWYSSWALWARVRAP